MRTLVNVPRGLILAKEKTALEELNKIPRVGAAGYDSGRPNAPERCLKDTRTVVLKKKIGRASCRERVWR